MEHAAIFRNPTNHDTYTWEFNKNMCLQNSYHIIYIYNLHTTTRKQTTTHSQTTNVLNILITGFVSSNKCVTHIASLNFSHLENANREDTPNSLRREVPRLR